MSNPPPELVGHEVIICTRNRPDDLATALAAVAESSHRVAVLVVDSSVGNDSQHVLERARSNSLSGWTVRYLKSASGLPLQRNVGLDNCGSVVAHFIDDDTEVFPNYFARLARIYDTNDETLVGVGGVQAHIPPRRTNFVRRIGQIEARPGGFSASGVNNLVTNPQEGPVSVDWLSGCCMSFRTDVARRTRFDESLIGYALGEDVEFSLRIAKHGRLLVDTAARVHHHLSETNRLNIQSNVRDTLRHRWRIINQHPERFSVAAFRYSVVVDIARYAVGTVLGRAASREALAGVRAARRDCSNSR